MPDVSDPPDTRVLPRQRAVIRTIADDRRVRYVFVGGIAAVVYYAVFSGIWLLDSGRIPYLVTALIANVTCAVLTYPLYRVQVFRSSVPWVPGFFRFYLVCLWNLFFSLAGLPLLVEIAHVHVLISQAIIIIIAPLINYQLSKFWIFRHRGG